MKEKIAIIGTGIAGMASAYYLREHFDVTLIEKNDYVGGHTNTIRVNENGRSIPIDTGFMVFNDKTYPNLIRLFDELEVTSYDTSMSFGVHRANHSLEFACGGFSNFFAQKRNIANPFHWKLYKDILHFFKAADDLIQQNPLPSVTIADFAQKYTLSDRVLNNFILPMAGAIWSTPPEGILKFPALPMLRFMSNHQMLGIGIQLQWKTVENGSEQYKEKLLSKLPRKPLTKQSISRISQDDHGAYFIDNNGVKQRYDQIIIATHANHALELLETPSTLQHSVLSNFQYNKNTAILHSDTNVMPAKRNAWASWNVRSTRDSEGNTQSSTNYWMNNLQNLDTDKDYFVSIDYQDRIDPSKIHWQTKYEHPLFNEAAINAQARLPELNKNSRIRFCGSYFRNGFHEDALWSALQAVNSILQEREANHELMPL